MALATWMAPASCSALKAKPKGRHSVAQATAEMFPRSDREGAHPSLILRPFTLRNSCKELYSRSGELRGYDLTFRVALRLPAPS